MMMKKLLLGVAVCFGISIMSNDVIGTDLAEVIEKGALSRQYYEQDVKYASSDSDDSMCSLSDEEEELADRACYSHTDIVMLLAHLQRLNYHEAKDKYKLILDRWNDNNMYELMDTGNSFIGCCERNYYDF